MLEFSSQFKKFVLVTSVIDSGIGISKENLKHVFGRFERFDEKRNRGIEGSGVGLAIVKNLVDLSKLGEESDKKKRTVFNISEAVLDTASNFETTAISPR